MSQVTQPVVQMDGILEDALRAAAQEMTKKQREADHSDQMAMNLTSSMSQLQVDTGRPHRKHLYYKLYIIVNLSPTC